MAQYLPTIYPACCEPRWIFHDFQGASRSISFRGPRVEAFYMSKLSKPPSRGCFLGSTVIVASFYYPERLYSATPPWPSFGVVHGSVAKSYCRGGLALPSPPIQCHESFFWSCERKKGSGSAALRSVERYGWKINYPAPTSTLPSHSLSRAPQKFPGRRAHPFYSWFRGASWLHIQRLSSSSSSSLFVVSRRDAQAAISNLLLWFPITGSASFLARFEAIVNAVFQPQRPTGKTSEPSFNWPGPGILVSPPPPPWHRPPLGLIPNSEHASTHVLADLFLIHLLLTICYSTGASAISAEMVKSLRRLFSVTAWDCFFYAHSCCLRPLVGVKIMPSLRERVSTSVKIYLYLPTTFVFAGFPGPYRLGIGVTQHIAGPGNRLCPAENLKVHVVVTLLSPQCHFSLDPPSIYGAEIDNGSISRENITIS